MFYLIDEEGFLLGTCPFLLKEDEGKPCYIETDLDPFVFCKPKWKKKEWIEGGSKEEIENFFQQKKEILISSIKFKASNKIEAFFPLYKQFNSERENTNGHLFKWLDEVREISNDLEEKVKKCKSLKSLEKISIEYPEPPEA